MSNIALPEINNSSIAIIGLGYVGLPLAVEFAKLRINQNNSSYRTVIGFDTNIDRIQELKNGFDKTNDISKEELLKVLLFKYFLVYPFLNISRYLMYRHNPNILFYLDLISIYDILYFS